MMISSGASKKNTKILGVSILTSLDSKQTNKYYNQKNLEKLVKKYSKAAKTEHIMPAKLNKSDYNKVLKIAKRAHKCLDCKGVTRSDFKFYKKKFYLLELNTQPGMTSLSLVPEIAEYKNISFSQLVNWMVKDASLNR